MREEGKEMCKKPEDYIRPDIVEKCKTIMAYREAGKTFTWIAKEIGGFRNGDNLNSWFSHYTKAYESHGIAGKASLYSLAKQTGISLGQIINYSKGKKRAELKKCR